MKQLSIYLVLLSIWAMALPPQTTSAAPLAQTSEAGAWPMVAANPQRTSWTPEEVTGNLRVEWYRPIEAYIPQNVQVIAANGLLYVATSAGLYALDAVTGAVAWRYDTAAPLGNSPTVDGGVLYVGGYDRKLHALDALTGAYLWSYAGAGAGFSTNPLVIDGKVIAGNRDGSLYAVGAHATPQQGQLLWRFDAGGPILMSPAYQDGVVYFAAEDNHAYAVNASTGAQLWKSAKLPSAGFHSYWAVIFGDKVVFAGAPTYRGGSPGLSSVKDAEGTGYGSYNEMEREALFPTEPYGTLIGPAVPDQDWASGLTVLDLSRITEYHEQNPNLDPHVHKPWRRTHFVLSRSSGTEFTFDGDGDGFPETIPVAKAWTNSGNVYPPVIGPDGMLYQFNYYQNQGIAQGRVMGWQTGTSLMSVIGGQGSIDEPRALSAGGQVIYRNLCCDRVGDYFGISSGQRSGVLWTYNNNLETQAPGYDSMWTILPGLPRLQGWYKGSTNSVNAAYHNHGDQNPIVPYRGRLYVHRSNAIIAYGPGSGPGQLPALAINPVQELGTPLSQAEVLGRLSVEVREILDAGNLRPGYYQVSQMLTRGFEDPFSNPGETLYTLARAYPFLAPDLQEQVRAYLRSTFTAYFDPAMYATVGWNGAAREAWTIPPEVAADMETMGPSTRRPSGFTFAYPQQNFYALWLYAQVVPEDAARAYALAKSKLQLPLPAGPVADYYSQQPYELNAYISGYQGFLNLQQMAGMQQTDQTLSTQVRTELDRILQMRIALFSKDSYWTTDGYHKKHFDLARNFMFLTPELAGHLYANLPSQVTAAIAEYSYIAPYWFVSQYESTLGEGTMSILHNYYALFQAKAMILDEPGADLTRYIDVPAFARGDLFYLQNLTAVLENYGLEPGGPNQNPVAGADTAATAQGAAVSIPVLANDTDPDGDALAVVNVGTPGHGTASVNSSANAVTYVPSAGFSGSDSFTYMVTDGRGGWATATVTVTVAGSSFTSGDVDCSTTVDAVDAMFVLQFDVGLKQSAGQCPLPADALLLPACDVNADSACNTVDALFILQCSVGMDNTFCPVTDATAPEAQTQPSGPALLSEASLVVPLADIEAGETLLIPLFADIPDDNMGAAAVDIHYDPAVLQPIACSPAPEGGIDYASCNAAYQADGAAPDVIRVNAVSAAGLSGRAVVANLTFEAKAQMEATTTLQAFGSTWTDAGEPVGANLQLGEPVVVVPIRKLALPLIRR